MKVFLRKCSSCQNYTLHEKCSCGGEALSAHPAKYSFEDKYAQYRRKAKYPQVFD